MADSSGAPQRPPSLREVLDAGNDLTPVGGWLERIAELVYIDLPLTPPSKRAPWAADARTKALDLACRRRGRRRREGQERALYWHWAADLFEAPELAGRVIAALPADVAADFDAVAEELRRPYPLVVRTPETWWRCNNCGDGELRDELTYCFGCVGLLANVAHDLGY
jgi:hypothetical protein